MLEKTPKIKQHNCLTAAKYEMTAMEKNIVYMATFELQRQNAEAGTKLIAFKISSLEHLAGTSYRYADLRQALRRLVQREVRVKKPGEDWAKHGIAWRARIAAGEVILYPHSKMVEELLDLGEMYTALNLVAALSFKSIHSKRLYECLCQWRKTGFFVIRVVDLKALFGLIDPNTGEEKYKKWFLFWTKVVQVAIKEVSEKSEFRITSCKPVKEGRKIVRLEIRFEDRSKQKSLPTSSETAAKEAAKPAQWTEGQKKCFAGLTEIHGWLADKEKLAKKLVINVPSEELGHAIGRYKELCEGGTPSPPGEYFAALLDAQKSIEGEAFSTPKIPNLAAPAEAKKAGETRVSSSRKKGSLEETKPQKDMPEVLAKSAASAKPKVAVPPPPEVSALLQKLKKEEQEKTLRSTKETVESVWKLKTEQPLELSPFASASWSWSETDSCAEVVFREGLGEEATEKIREFFSVGSYFSRLKYQRLPQKINVVLEGSSEQYCR